MSGVSNNWDVFGGELLEESIINLRFIKDDGAPSINKVFYGKYFREVEQLKEVLENTIREGTVSS